MLCAANYLHLGARLVSKPFLSPMCPPPSIACSRGLASQIQQSSSSGDIPKRKQGISLASSPIQQGHYIQGQSIASFIDNGRPSPFVQPPGTTDDDRFQSARSRQSCEFITFKGLSSLQYRKAIGDHKQEGQAVEMDTSQRNGESGEIKKGPLINLVPPQANVDDSGFQTVNLNDMDKKQADMMEHLKSVSLGSSSEKNNGKADSGPPAKPHGNELKPPFKFAGVVGCLMATLFFSVSILCIKLLPNCNTIQEKSMAVLIRGIFLTIFCATTILYQGGTFAVRRDEMWLNFFRTTVGFFGVYGAYTALQFITLGESTAIIYTSPAWSTILSYFFLNESFPITLVVAIPLGFFGIILIAHPDLLLGESVVEFEIMSEVDKHHHHHMMMMNESLASHMNGSSHVIGDQVLNALSNFTSNGTAEMISEAMELDPYSETELYLQQRWPGILIALGTSFVYASVFIMLKFRKTTPIQTVTFYLGVGTIIMSTLIQAFIGFGHIPVTWLEWVLLFGMGFNSYLGQVALQWSLQYEKANILSIVRTMDVVMSFCWGALFLGEDILWTSLLGASIIMLVVAILMVNKYIEELFCSSCKK